MLRKADNEIVTAYFHIFPSVKLPSTMEKIGSVTFKSKSLIADEIPRFREFLESLFSLFTDPFDNLLEEGIYIANENPLVVEDAWLLLRFAAYIPREDDEIFLGRRNPDLADWFMFYTPWHQDEESEKLDMVSVEKNGVKIWDVFWRTGFSPYLQRFHKSSDYLYVTEEGLAVAKRLANIFEFDSEFVIETIQLAERLRKAIYWYNLSFGQMSGYHNLKSSFWKIEEQILYTAIAFETLFQPPSTAIQKHLEISLKVLFPDNEFVPKWLYQFYKARSAIAHGSSLGTDEVEFKPDRRGHNSLIYWGRKIFRACVEAIVLQWETVRKSGLLKLMTPNRIRLNRLLGKLRSIGEDELIKTIPEEVQADIRDLHASWMDIPDETYLEHTHNIGKILCSVAVRSSELVSDVVYACCGEILSLPHDWYRTMERRDEACHIYERILAAFGDKSNVLDRPIEIESNNEFEKTLYHWAKFAYAHIWSIDI